MANIFVNATTARRDTRNNSIIHSEIRSIEAVVLANIDAGVLYANVTSNTTMTNSNVYYNVYNVYEQYNFQHKLICLFLYFLI